MLPGWFAPSINVQSALTRPNMRLNHAEDLSVLGLSLCWPFTNGTDWHKLAFPWYLCTLRRFTHGPQHTKLGCWSRLRSMPHSVCASRGIASCRLNSRASYDVVEGSGCRPDLHSNSSLAAYGLDHLGNWSLLGAHITTSNAPLPWHARRSSNSDTQKVVTTKHVGSLISYHYTLYSACWAQGGHLRLMSMNCATHAM